MWSALLAWVKSLFTGKGSVQLGRGNQAMTASSTGNNSPVIAAGGDVHYNVQGSTDQPTKSEPEQLQDWFREKGHTEPLSQVLRQLMRLAGIVGNSQIERWARLELLGYDREGTMKETDVVPEYRTVVGQYYDNNGRPLPLRGKLYFLNGDRFRFGAATLEEFAQKTEMQNIINPGMVEVIEEEFHVKISHFSFNPLAVADVVNAIRNRALDMAHELEVARS